MKFIVEAKVLREFEIEAGGCEDEVDAETEVLQKISDLGETATDLKITCADPEYPIDTGWFSLAEYKNGPG